jgi:hypothetical protein
MKTTVIKILKKLKVIVIDKYMLLLLVPLGFILEFIITAPFLILCTLDNLFGKKHKTP